MIRRISCGKTSDRGMVCAARNAKVTRKPAASLNAGGGWSTQRAMARAGIVKECGDCAVNGEGTCCGVRTGYKYGCVLLLINLLMGRILPPAPADTHLCHFLTKQGCALRARHVICVNFVCQRLRDVLPHDSLYNVQDIAGGEIDTLFVLEECIKKKIGVATLLRAQKQWDEKM
jgi:hypothetical protein